MSNLHLLGIGCFCHSREFHNSLQFPTIPLNSPLLDYRISLRLPKWCSQSISLLPFLAFCNKFFIEWPYIKIRSHNSLYKILQWTFFGFFFFFWITSKLLNLALKSLYSLFCPSILYQTIISFFVNIFSDVLSGQ